MLLGFLISKVWFFDYIVPPLHVVVVVVVLFCPNCFSGFRNNLELEFFWFTLKSFGDRPLEIDAKTLQSFQSHHPLETFFGDYNLFISI